MNLDPKLFLPPFILMFFIDFTNIIVNIFLVYALRKLKKLHILSYRFILLMSISDICVGLSGIFSHTINIINIPKGKYYSDFQYYAGVILLFFASFTGRFTVIIALDRYVRMRYLTQYEEIMTNKRAVLLVSGNALIGLVSSIAYLGPFSPSFKDIYTLGWTLFHVVGITSSCLLYIFAFRSLKRAVDNLHIESNIGNETKPVENVNTVEATQAVQNTEKNDSSHNYHCAPKCNDVLGSCNVRSRSDPKYQPDCECADTSNNGRANGHSANTSSNCPDNGCCADTIKNGAQNDLCKRRSNSVPGMDPSGKASTIAKNNVDMLVDDVRNGPSTDPCSTARIDLNNELRICIKDKNIDDDTKESDKILSLGILHEPECHIQSKDPIIQITKPLENNFKTKKSLESRSVEEIVNEPQNRNDVEHNDVKNGRGANIEAEPKNNRRRPDHDFAKSVLLITVAMLFCYLPGVIVYFASYPDMRSMTYAHALTWCLLLTYLNSTLNAIIFISCSSELRLYVKSFFTRIMESG